MRVVMKVMIKPQGQIDHEGDFGDDLGAAAETGDEVTNVAVVLLDGESQVFAGEELILRNEAVKPFPLVGQEGFALDPNFIEELLTEPAPAFALGSVQIAEFPSFCHALQDFEAMFEGDGPPEVVLKGAHSTRRGAR